MKIESFEGIVLTETNYGESSKILNVLSDKYGLIGIMSKGCRKAKNKLQGVSRKLIHGTFHIYYKEKGLSTLIGVDVLHSFSNTLTDLEKETYALFVLDLTHQVLKQSDDLEIYPLLRDTLIKIEEGFDPFTLSNILELKLLDYLGSHLSLDECSICGSTKAIVTISGDQGGFICKNCHQNEPYISEDAIKMIRMFYYLDISKIQKLDISKETLQEINQFLDDYYDRFTGVYMKSKNFMKMIQMLK